MPVAEDRCKERMKNVEKRQDITDSKLDNTKESLDKLLGSMATAKWMIGIGLPMFAALIISVGTLQLNSLKDSIRRNEVRPINHHTGLNHLTQSKKKLRSSREILANNDSSPTLKLSNGKYEIKACDSKRD